MKKVLLVIMDGWGKGSIPEADAIFNAHTPFVDSLYTAYPHTSLVACGEAVGLPEGQMGNSEVGHLNLGAGRVVYQELERINVAIRSGEFAVNPQLLRALETAKQNNKPLHLIGLVSDGGVHSHINHVKAILTLAKEHGLKDVFVHAFTDGRDCDPKSAVNLIADLQNHMQSSVGSVASIVGRYYAMDRDKRWERVKLAYDALVNGVGESSVDVLASITHSYEQGVTDEFLKPIINTTIDTTAAKIKDGDVVICFNFRTDRCREITSVLTQEDYAVDGMHKLDLDYTTMTQYDKNFKNINVMFEKDNLDNTLGEIIASVGLKQVRIAETEKYPHVTFFFGGGREHEFDGESRVVVPSPKVATYDLQPEMSAYDITNTLIPEIEKGDAAFMCINYANTDMVGHTGDFKAAQKAAETVDHCVSQVIPKALEHGYTVFLTADHGNSDYMINPDGTPNTQHSLNEVPLFIIDNEWHGTLKQHGKLADIAPTILTMMNIPVPKEMTGDILIEK